MTRSRRSASTLGVATTLLLVACGGGGKASVSSSPVLVGGGTTTLATAAASTSSAVAGPTGWTVDLSGCADPARAEQPIVGTVKIGSAMPLSGGPAAAFAPVKDGFEQYLEYASDNDLLPGYTLSVDIRDDQYDGSQTAGVVNGLIGDGADIVAGIIGTPDNLAVRDTLNGQCIPQLLALTGSPAWGQVDDYPWTTGALVPYTTEADVYAAKLTELKPGAKVALFSVDDDFGKAYIDEFKAKADEYGFVLVDEQTVDEKNTDPPTTQVSSIAGKLPDAIVAIPLGVQCPVFLTELAKAKALNAAWTPVVFITNSCASKLFFGLAGAAADGVYTSNNLLDSDDPKNASAPGVKAFLDAYGAAGMAGDPAVTQAGWNIGEATVAILNAALKTGTLSRKSIIEAARNLTFTPSLARPGVQYKMNGAVDPYAFQTLQVLQWVDSSQTFTEIGDPITEFES